MLVQQLLYLFYFMLYNFLVDRRHEMKQLKETIQNSRKIVIKIGSNVLSDENGAVNRQVMHNIVEQVNDLIGMGKQVILV